MKTNLLFATLLLVAFSMISANANAQQKLTELTKKFETIDKVNVNSVEQRNPQTKKLTQIIRNYTVHSKALVNEILAAFAEDKKEAYTVIEDTKGSKVESYYYRFKEGNKDVSYSFTMDDDGSEATLTLIEKYE